ncbi:MAG TPA: hypothetical protein VGB37_17015 [Candidatus Lokiarchaeia archaeon]
MVKDNKNRTNKNLIFFNEAVEYFDHFKDNNFLNSQNLDITEENQLRDEMLSELNHLKDLIINNPDLKFNALSEEEKGFFYEFVRRYSICPICGTFNHYYNLKKFYFDENCIALRNNLIEFMNLSKEKIRNYNLNFGIPCCSCFKKSFVE